MSESKVGATVLHLITTMATGGAERVVVALANGAAESGVKCLVGVLTDRTELLEELDARVHVLRLTTKHSFVGLLRSAWRTAAEVRKHRIDVIHAHLKHALAVALLVRVLVPSVRIVFTVHSSLVRGFAWRMLLRSTKWMRKADVQFYNGQLRGVLRADAVVIRNGVELAASFPRSDPPADAPLVVLCVGRLEPVKNVGAVIEAFAAVSHPHAELWIVGDGPLRKSLELECRNHGVADRTRFWGLQRDVAPYYARAAVLAIASRWEGLPMVALEAGAAGLPILSTAVGGLPELLSGGCGVITTPTNFSAALSGLLADHDLRRELASNLRSKIAREYSRSAMLAAHMLLYNRVGARAASRARQLSHRP